MTLADKILMTVGTIATVGLIVSVCCRNLDLAKLEQVTQTLNKFDNNMVTLEGCKVGFVNEIPRVTNPEECSNKQFVVYLNCYDQMIKPSETRPEECRL